MGQRRLKWLAGIVAVWGAAICWNLVKLEVFHHQDYVRIARRSQEKEQEIPAPRGPILDRSGEPLAMSVPTETVTVDPLKVPDVHVASDLLALVLHLDRSELYTRMQDALEHHRGYLVVKSKITFKEGQNLRALKLDWVDIERKSERHYPGGTLAAHVLGSVDFNENGNAGVEKWFNSELLSSPGHERLLMDVKHRGVDSQVANDAKPGLALTLTIDERLQYIAERELAAAVESHHARTGSVVVMNMQTGEVLALASYPTYDPNIPPMAGDDPISRQNHAVSIPFEPGSVFKVMTLSAALETTNLTPDSPINCHNGSLTIYGRTIHDSHAGLGILPMAMVLAHSSNVGAAEVGLRVGQDNMYEYVRRFGFGQRTGIQLPAEAPGQLRRLAHWSKESLPSISIGQEISVTTVQLAQAASVIANGGLLVRPRLVLKIGDRTIPPVPPVRIIRPETAIEMRQMMEGVVLYGTGRLVAKLEGYSSAGKTGSAQIFDLLTHHYSHSYNGSFMGFAPVTNPSIVVVATVNGTHGTSGFGGPTAGPVFRAVTTEALRLLDVPKDLPEQEAKPLVLVADNTDNADDADDLADASLADGQPNILEDPEDDSAAPPNAVRVPNFRGMTMRAVLAEATSKGLSILPAGSGVARLQEPAAGAVLHEGERIRVRFAR